MNQSNVFIIGINFSLVTQKLYLGLWDYPKILFIRLEEYADLKQKWRGWDLNPRHKAYESYWCKVKMSYSKEMGKILAIRSDPSD